MAQGQRDRDRATGTNQSLTPRAFRACPHPPIIYSTFHWLSVCLYPVSLLSHTHSDIEQGSNRYIEQVYKTLTHSVTQSLCRIRQMETLEGPICTWMYPRESSSAKEPIFFSPRRYKDWMVVGALHGGLAMCECLLKPKGCTASADGPL